MEKNRNFQIRKRKKENSSSSFASFLFLFSESECNYFMTNKLFVSQLLRGIILLEFFFLFYYSEIVSRSVFFFVVIADLLGFYLRTFQIFFYSCIALAPPQNTNQWAKCSTLLSSFSAPFD